MYTLCIYIILERIIMQTHLQKWGNSLGMRIPMRLSQQLKLRPGSVVNVKIEDDRLIIFPHRYSLKEMLAAITDKNSHQEILEDGPKGQEEW